MSKPCKPGCTKHYTHTRPEPKTKPPTRLPQPEPETIQVQKYAEYIPITEEWAEDKVISPWDVIAEEFGIYKLLDWISERIER